MHNKKIIDIIINIENCDFEKNVIRPDWGVGEKKYDSGI